MRPGRNDPCPCGSGKKYKHCCLRAAAIKASAPEALLWSRLRGLLDGFAHRMMPFVEQSYGTIAMEEALDEFLMDRDLDLESDPALMQVFMPWFFHFWAPDVDTEISRDDLREIPPTAAYIARRRKQLDPLLVRYLESCLHTPLSFYDVVRCAPGERIVLRDIFTREEHEVTEREPSNAHEPGDIVLAQLAKVDGLTMIEAYGGFAIAPQEKASIVRLRARMLEANERITSDVIRDFDWEVLDLYLDIYQRAFHPAPPELTNSDGEPFSLRRLIYDLEVSPQAAFEALKHLALDEPEASILESAERDVEGALKRVSFCWKNKGNAAHPEWANTILGNLTIEPGRLTAEVNSAARADRFVALVEEALGEAAQFRVTQVVHADEMLAKGHAQAESGGRGMSVEHDELNNRPEVRAKLAEMVAAHFERWPETPLPILDGRTPREAVADADGREIVDALLMQFKRNSLRSGAPTDPGMIDRLRERLGLPPADG